MACNLGLLLLNFGLLQDTVATCFGLLGFPVEAGAARHDGVVQWSMLRHPEHELVPWVLGQSSRLWISVRGP